MKTIKHVSVAAIVAGFAASMPSLAKPDYAKFKPEVIELKSLPYVLSLKSPLWRISTSDGTKEMAKIEFTSGKLGTIHVFPDLGVVRLLNFNAVTDTPANDGGGAAYVKLHIAPISNSKTRWHRLSCAVSDSSTKITFAVRDRPSSVETVTGEDGLYSYDFATQKGVTQVFARPAGFSVVNFFGCTVSTIPAKG